MNYINRFKQILGVALLLPLLSSCADSWVELQPKDLVIYEDFWKTRAHLLSAIGGCYMATIDNYKEENPDYHTGVVGQMLLWGELRADNIIPGGSILSDEARIMFNTITPNNRLCKYGRFYAVINNCNTLLENADGVMAHDKTLSMQEVNTYKAEALALRSLMYFYLVRTYKEVPLVLKASSNSLQNFDAPKSTEEVILTQLITDLNTAYKDAMAAYPTSDDNKGRFTKTSIAALLADVYLWAEKYPECIQMCDNVFLDKKVVLVKNRLGDPWTYNVFVRGNSNESIFELQYGDSYEGKPNHTLYQAYGSSAKSPHFSVPLDPSNWDLSTIYKEGDTRMDEFIMAPKGSISGSVYKFQQNESSRANWPVYRLPEVYLMKAEAMVQLDFEKNKEDALRLVNTVYMRSNPLLTSLDSLQIDDFSTQQKLADLILLERQREFLFEGKRWFDLLRTSRREQKQNPESMRVFLEFVLRNIDLSVRPLAEAKFKYVDKKDGISWSHYLPIPQGDIDADPKKVLKQNPFYETLVE